MTDNNRPAIQPKDKKRWRSFVVVAASGAFLAVFVYASRTYEAPESGVAPTVVALPTTVPELQRSTEPVAAPIDQVQQPRRVIVVPFPDAVTRAS
jgi:hypothetical protein